MSEIYAESAKGYFHDRQNLGIYLEQGATLKTKKVEEGTVDNQLIVDLLNDDAETEKRTEVASDWTEISVDNDSVPFVRTNQIKSANYYNLSDNDGYALLKPQFINSELTETNTIYYANIFDTKCENEEINEITVPVYGCDSVEVYINTTSGDLNSTDYQLVSKADNPSAGWYECYIPEPISISGEKFCVAVKYVGETVPYNLSTKSQNYTYTSNSLNENWKKFTGTETEDGVLKYKNIPPIKCAGKDVGEGNSSVTLEIDITDIFNEDSKIKPLTYLNDGDDEEAFFNSWTENRHSFAVAENDRVTFLIPYRDKDVIFNQTKKENEEPIASFREAFDFYNGLFIHYDQIFGVDDDAPDRLNRNTKSKYFVKANVHGAGLAYYCSDHTAFNGNSIKSYFTKNWMILHEIGHGYEGCVTHGNIDLSECGNNIYAYYHQQTYLAEGEYGWLGNIDNIEQNYYRYRNTLTTFNDLTENNVYNSVQFQMRLYFFVNLLNKIGPEKSMSQLYKDIRIAKAAGTSFNMSEMIYESFSNSSNYDLTDYFDSWKIPISDEVRARVAEKGFRKLHYLNDLVGDKNISKKIEAKYNLKGIYSLVTEEEYQEYLAEITPDIKIQNKTLTGATVTIGDVTNTEDFTEETFEKDVKVTCDKPCVVITTTDSGETYQKLTPTATEDANTYVFTLNTEENVDVIVALKGDVNMNGSINITDASLIDRSRLTEDQESYRALSKLEEQMADVSGSGGVNITDSSLIMRSRLTEDAENYKPIEW